MERVLIGLLALGATTIGLITRVDRATAEPRMATQGAVLLQTQPASVGQSSYSIGTTPYTRENLNSISASIQSRPQATAQKSGFPTSIIPRGLETSLSPSSSSSVSPLDFFKVQAPDRSVRFRVSDTP